MTRYKYPDLMKVCLLGKDQQLTSKSSAYTIRSNKTWKHRADRLLSSLDIKRNWV